MKRKLTLLIFLGALLKLMSQEPYVFEEENGLVVIEAESTPSYGLWSPDTAILGYFGDNYLLYQGANYYNSPGNSLLTYKIQISKVGKYRFQWRSRIAKGTSNTDHNDSWLRIEDASKFYAQKSSSVLYPHGSGMSPNPEGAGSNGWFKIYQNVLNDWTWNTSTNDNNPYSIYVEFDSIGIYTIEISGRSNGHSIDRIVLYHSDVTTITALDASLPESPKSIISSIDEVIMELNIFPNPAKEYLEISLPQSLLQKNTYTLRILDVSGRVVKQFTKQKLKEKRRKITIDDIPSGIYFLSIISEKTLYKSEFVKL